MKLHLLGWAGCSRAMIGPLYEGRMELVAPDERLWNQALSACLAGIIISHPQTLANRYFQHLKRGLRFLG